MMLRKAVRFKTSALVTAAVVAVVTSGCVSTSTGVKDNDFRAKQLSPELGKVAVAADLDVSPKKVLGRASGDFADREYVEREAVLNAFSRDPLGANSSDVLVAPSFFYVYDVDNSTRVTGSGGISTSTTVTGVTVTVVGYPARYKNFRPDPKLKKNNALLMESVGGNSFISYPVPREKTVEDVTAATPEPEQAPEAAPEQPIYQAPAYQAPAQAPAPAYQAPAQKPAPAQAPVPAYQAPAQKPAQAPAPAQAPVPAYQAPAQKPAPANQAPAQAPVPAYQAPAQKPAPVNQAPVPAYQAPAPAQQKPVTNTPKE